MASSTAAQVGVLVTADVAGGMAAGAGTKMLANAYECKNVTDNVLSTALIGGVTGGIASGATLGAGHAITHMA